MKRLLLILGVVVIVAGFVRGWFALSEHREAQSRKIDVNLTIDPDKMNKDANQVGTTALELKDKAKDKLSR